ncbi:MAG TPA: hypothetical protein VFJ58_09820 [Armatimonadota bacterium]|nr:hypothetical protein [Armatimonadota bacterium]
MLWLFFALLAGSASAGLGQDAPAGAGAPQPPGPTTAVSRPVSPAPAGSLAAAMIQAKPPDDQIAIAIGADLVRPPHGITALPGSTVYHLSDLFGMLARPFGGVIAIAPPTMTILNTAPGAPNPFEGMPPADAFKLLVGSLSPAQWQTLTSAQGLGLGDLKSDDQRELFRAIFPQGGLRVAPMPPSGVFFALGDYKPIKPGDADRAHIRLTRYTNLGLSTIEGHGSVGLGYPPGLQGAHSYEGNNGLYEQSNVDTLYGVRVRKKAPNTPKPGNLDFNAAALQTPIPLSGAKTVEGLIQRISRATRVELYADRRYEDREIVIAAGARAARAADLLQAMAFCLRGTYRRVGPAFVLTDDLIGVGTRRTIIERLRLDADNARRGLLYQAGDTILQLHSIADLPPGPGAVSITPDQFQQALKHQPKGLINPIRSIQVPADELTPEQQDAAQKVMDGLIRERNEVEKMPDRPGKPFLKPLPTLDGPVTMSMSPVVQLLLPSLDGPVNMGDLLNPGLLFSPSPELGETRAAALTKALLARAPASRMPSLAAVLKPIPHRAVIVEAHTAAGVDSVVTSMRQLGLNELWLEVFDPGVPDVSTKSELDGGDLLTEALKATRETDIRVLPVLRLLKWRASTPVAERDLSILGEESPAAIARRRVNDGAGPSLFDGPPEAPRALAVSPFEPKVQDRLTKLMANLAREPGIAGLVWRSPTLPGYSVHDDDYPSDVGSEFGYTERARLAFLRVNHVDPVDIDPLTDRDSAAALPGFDDIEIDRKLQEEWRIFRANEDENLLRRLLAAASSTEPGSDRNQPSSPGTTAGRLPVLVEASGPEYFEDYVSIWYGSWSGDEAPLPAAHFFGGEAGLAKEAHAGSKIAILSLAPDENWAPGKTASTIESLTKHPVWDGVVLDLTTPHTGPGRAPTGAERLAALAK